MSPEEDAQEYKDVDPDGFPIFKVFVEFSNSDVEVAEIEGKILALTFTYSCRTRHIALHQHRFST